MLKWMITGANGNLGRRLIKALLPEHEVVAVVRSNKAADTVSGLTLTDDERARLSLQVLDYADVTALREAAAGCTRVVHLVGILKEAHNTTYSAAHEQSCTALAQALAGGTVEHVTYLSIVGSRPDADNACLASKGRAEAILTEQTAAACILRVPMVLGEGDYASFALQKRAAGGMSFTFRASSMEQPIYAGDVVAAIVSAGREKLAAVLDLGGPEALTRAELTHRAASVLGNQARVISLPISVGYCMAWVFERISSNPPVTRAMLGVLDHDDVVESAAAWQQLALAPPTPLDEMLAKVLKRS